MTINIIWIIVKFYLLFAVLFACILQSILGKMEGYNGKFKTVPYFFVILLFSLFSWFVVFVLNPIRIYLFKREPYIQTVLFQVSIMANFLDTIFEDVRKEMEEEN